MTTKELYQLAKNATDFTYFLLFYTYKNKDGVVQLGPSVPMSKEVEDDVNVSKMEKIERDTENFMFWNHDPKSSKWFEENYKAIQEQFIKYILGVNGFGPKISKN